MKPKHRKFIDLFPVFRVSTRKGWGMQMCVLWTGSPLKVGSPGAQLPLRPHTSTPPLFPCTYRVFMRYKLSPQNHSGSQADGVTTILEMASCLSKGKERDF